MYAGKEMDDLKYHDLFGFAETGVSLYNMLKKLNNIFIVCFFILVPVFKGFANTETLTWYVDRAVYDTTTCQSGGDVILPTPPTKRGYTFQGWLTSEYMFSSLDATENGTHYFYILQNNTCGVDGSSTTCTDADFADLTAGRWKVIFSYGTVYGRGMCSSSSGTANTVGNPNTTGSGTTRYCWCKVTDFMPNGEDVMYGPVSDTPWVFRYDYTNANSCASGCALNCSGVVQRYPAIRSTFFNG